MNQRESDDPVQRGIPSFLETGPPLINNPFMKPRPDKATNLLEKFDESSGLEDVEAELVQVYLRLKPCKFTSNIYEVQSDQCLVTSLDTATAGHGRRTQHNVAKMYTFTRIFKPECNQKVSCLVLSEYSFYSKCGSNDLQFLVLPTTFLCK